MTQNADLNRSTTHSVQNCYPCLRNKVLPMSQEEHSFARRSTEKSVHAVDPAVDEGRALRRMFIWRLASKAPAQMAVGITNPEMAPSHPGG
jgi:hypothetical protein